MQKLDNQISKIFSSFEFIASWLIRIGLGIAFSIHGLGKFPLPPEGLVDYFGFSPALASLVAISELGAGILIIVGGFINNSFGNLLTRASAFTIVIIMINALSIAHRDWFINTKLFTSEQIFLLLIGLFFLIKGNK